MLGQAQRGGGGTFSIHLQPAAMRRRWVSAPCFGHFALVKIHYLLYGRLGGSLSQSGWHVKSSNKLCSILHSRSVAVNAILYYTI